MCHRVFVGERSADVWAYENGRLVLFKYSQELATIVAQQSDPYMTIRCALRAKGLHMRGYGLWAELEDVVHFDTLDYVPLPSSSSDEDSE